MAQINDGLGIRFLGDKELEQFFKESLKFGQQKAIFLAGYRRAAKPIVKTAKMLYMARRKNNEMPSETYKSIGVKPSKSRKPMLLVGARTFGDWKGHAGVLIDSGTKQRSYTNKKGETHNTGRMPANHFWTDTLAMETKNVQKVMSDEMLKALDRFVQRNLKRINKVA